jgi:hypothetical protein
MAGARRHHYVPQCYLKGFSVPRKKMPQVVVFDRLHGRSFQTGIDNVAAIRDFNRVDLDGYDPNVFETQLAAFETELADALVRIIEAKSISADEDRTYLLNLVALLALHNPRWREMRRRFQEQIAKAMMGMIVSTPERYAATLKEAKEAGHTFPDSAVDYQAMRDFVRDGAFTIEVPNEHQLATEIDGIDHILPLLVERRWVLLVAPEGSGGFITSDHPVCLMWSNPDARAKSFHGPGFGLKNTQVIFPISTSLAMVGTFEGNPGVMSPNENFVAAINGTVAHFAERQAFARDLHFRYSVSGGGETRKASRLASERTFRRAPAPERAEQSDDDAHEEQKAEERIDVPDERDFGVFGDRAEDA